MVLLPMWIMINIFSSILVSFYMPYILGLEILCCSNVRLQKCLAYFYKVNFHKISYQTLADSIFILEK